MNSAIFKSTLFKLVLLSCLFFQAGCDITFKRKSATNTDVKNKVSNTKNKLAKSFYVELFNEKDSQIITSFYIDKENETVRHDMIMLTKLSKKEQGKLVKNENISRNIQVIPLPLILERKLSTLPLHLLRVQVATRIILMNVRTRKILDIIEI